MMLMMMSHLFIIILRSGHKMGESNDSICSTSASSTFFLEMRFSHEAVILNRTVRTVIVGTEEGGFLNFKLHQCQSFVKANVNLKLLST